MTLPIVACLQVIYFSAAWRIVAWASRAKRDIQKEKYLARSKKTDFGGVAFKTARCFCRGPRLGPQHSRGDPQPSLTPVPGCPVPTSDFTRRVHTYTQVNSHTYRNNIIFFKKCIFFKDYTDIKAAVR